MVCDQNLAANEAWLLESVIAEDPAVRDLRLLVLTVPRIPHGLCP